VEGELGPIGSKLRLTKDITVLKGTFLKGSTVTLLKYAQPNDIRGEFTVKDDDSGEELLLAPALGGYEKIGD
jgi:hypothetical protein